MEKKPMLSTIRFLVRHLTRFNVINGENIPQTGALLMTSNHLSRLDTPLLMSITDRNDLVGIIGKSYQNKTLIRWILERIGTMIWMDRETIDFEAIRNALYYLRQDLVVGIAPEGTRSRESKSLMEGKQGAALLAARASVKILPVGIAGSEKIIDELLKLRRPIVNIRVGKVYTLPEMDMDDRQGWLQRSTDEIMCRIAAQLPPQYRGFYAEHPRLQALLREDEQES